MNFKRLYCLYKEIITYIIFGICTIFVNVIVYLLLSRVFKVDIVPSAILAWCVAVLFSYITNRKFVFRSKVQHLNGKIVELMCFFGSRLFTGIIDWLCMYIFVDIFLYNDIIVKVLINFIVIILNYIFSKLLFKN